MSIRDIVKKMPKKRAELSDYITKHYDHVNDLIKKNPEYKTNLADAVNESFDKYSKYMGGLTSKISGAGHAAGYTADAWLLMTGDIVGNLGGKFLHLLGQIPEKAYGVMYGVRTGNYLDSAQNILEGLISYLPLCTFVDQGLTRIVQKRIVKDAVTNFEKSIGAYKPWTQKIAEKIKGKYTGVKDRLSNIFSPRYKPSPQPV